jgi:hypothetical protein
MNEVVAKLQQVPVLHWFSMLPCALSLTTVNCCAEAVMDAAKTKKEKRIDFFTTNNFWKVKEIVIFVKTKTHEKYCSGLWGL